MAASTSTSFTIPVSASTARVLRNRRRRITPQAGRALGEFAQRGGAISARDAQIQAMQLHMALNRQIYFDCSVAPAVGERCRTLLFYPKA
jgi:hypothetical protein